MDFGKLEHTTKKLTLNKLRELVVQAAMMNEAELVDLNTDALSKGYLSNGKRTDKYAGKAYEEFKKFKGSPVPHMDWKLEGDFHSGFFIEPKKEFVLFDSKDDKTSEIEGRQGTEVFGLGGKWLKAGNEAIENDFVILVENEINKR